MPDSKSLTGFCEDFSITVGRNTVTVEYKPEEVCFSAEPVGDYFCIPKETIMEMRQFINERSGESVTAIVNEFQYYFAVRRQRAFWIVRAMTSGGWCVLEVVAPLPGCAVFDDEYGDQTTEFTYCLDSVIDVTADFPHNVVDVLIDGMKRTGIKVLAGECPPGPGASYNFQMRFTKWSETQCSYVSVNLDELEAQWVAFLRSQYRGGEGE